jgi:hypothetical protein
MFKKVEIDLSGASSEIGLIDKFYETLLIEESVRDNWDAFYDNIRDVHRLSKLPGIKEAKELVIDVFGCADLPEKEFLILRDILVSTTDDTQRNDGNKIYVRLTR